MATVQCQDRESAKAGRVARSKRSIFDRPEGFASRYGSGEFERAEKREDEHIKNLIWQSENRGEKTGRITVIEVDAPGNIERKSAVGDAPRRFGSQPLRSDDPLGQAPTRKAKREQRRIGFDPARVLRRKRARGMPLRKLVILKRQLGALIKLLSAGYETEAAKKIGLALTNMGLIVGSAFVPIPGLGTLGSAGLGVSGSLELVTSGAFGAAFGVKGAKSVTKGAASEAFSDPATSGHLAAPVPRPQDASSDFEINDETAWRRTTRTGRLESAFRNSALGKGLATGAAVFDTLAETDGDPGSWGASAKKVSAMPAAAVTALGATAFHVAKNSLYDNTTKPMAIGAMRSLTKLWVKAGLAAAEERIARQSAAQKGPVLHWLLELDGFAQLETLADTLQAQCGGMTKNISNKSNFMRQKKRTASEVRRKIDARMEILRAIAEYKWNKHRDKYFELHEAQGAAQAQRGDGPEALA